MFRFVPFTLLFAACADISDTPVAPDVNDPNAARGTVTGSVSAAGEADGPSAEAVTVTVFRVEVDGSLTPLSAAVETDADGRFAASVILPDGPETDLVVDAAGDGWSGRAIVNATLTEGGTVEAGEIDAESSAEARVFVSLQAQGAWDAATMSTAMIEAAIDAEAAAEAEDEDDVDFGAFVSATLAAVTGWSAAAESLGGDLEAALAATTEAAVAADAGESDMSPADLWSAFDAVGYTAAEIALMGHAAAEAAATVAAETAGDTSADAVAAASEALRADLAAQAIAEAAARLDLSSDANGDTEQAGASLVARVGAALDTAADAPFDEVTGAWSDFETELTAILAADLSATTWAAVSAADEAASESEAALDAAIAAATEVHGHADSRARTIATAMVAFADDVHTDAAIQALATTELGADGASAMATILTQLHASVR